MDQQLAMIDLPKNSKGDFWILDCRFPMQRLLRDLGPDDVGREVRLRSGDIYVITAYRPNSELQIELKKIGAKTQKYVKKNGLACRQYWHGIMFSADDVVSFHGE